jgi:phosphoserine aminotransferase
MEPYTSEGMAWREAQVASTPSSTVETPTLSRQSSVVIENVSPSIVLPTTPTKSFENRMSDTDDSHSSEAETAKGMRFPAAPSGNSLCVAAATSAAIGMNHINYELVGIVVHSGQANAGHYYSFIKDRRYVVHCISIKFQF